MKDELEQLMSAATGRADYAEARHVASNVERITTRNGAVDEVDRSESAGAGKEPRVPRRIVWVSLMGATLTVRVDRLRGNGGPKENDTKCRGACS